MEEISWTGRVRNGFINSQEGEDYLTSDEKEGMVTGLVTSCVGTAF
jgi:hypothetical protein